MPANAALRAPEVASLHGMKPSETPARAHASSPSQALNSCATEARFGPHTFACIDVAL